MPTLRFLSYLLAVDVAAAARGRPLIRPLAPKYRPAAVAAHGGGHLSAAPVGPGGQGAGGRTSSSAGAFHGSTGERGLERRVHLKDQGIQQVGSSPSLETLQDAEGRLLEIFGGSSRRDATLYFDAERERAATTAAGEPSVGALLDFLEAARPPLGSFDAGSLVGDWRLEYTTNLQAGLQERMSQEMKDSMTSLSVVLSIDDAGTMQVKASMSFCDDEDRVIMQRGEIKQLGNMPVFSMTDDSSDPVSVEVSYVSRSLLVLRKERELTGLMSHVLGDFRPKPKTEVWKRVEQADFDSWSMPGRVSLWRFGLPFAPLGDSKVRAPKLAAPPPGRPPSYRAHMRAQLLAPSLTAAAAASDDVLPAPSLPVAAEAGGGMLRVLVYSIMGVLSGGLALLVGCSGLFHPWRWAETSKPLRALAAARLPEASAGGLGAASYTPSFGSTFGYGAMFSSAQGRPCLGATTALPGTATGPAASSSAFAGTSAAALARGDRATAAASAGRGSVAAAAATETVVDEPRAATKLEGGQNEELGEVLKNDYEYGFTTNIESESLAKGLSEDVVREISKIKEEPSWMLDFRLRAFRQWQRMRMPEWGHLEMPTIDFQDIVYYSRPKMKKKKKSLDEVEPELLETFEKLGIPLTEQKRLTNVAVDAVFDSESIGTTFQKELMDAGVIFCSISEAIKEHPDLVKKYLGSVVPAGDNYFSALNAAVFSDGSFCYIPKGTRCPMEISTYFRMNNKESGQFERTLLVAEEGSYVSYLEGCTAPMFDTKQLHAAVVELHAAEDAEIKYSTVQNWYAGDENGRGGILNLVTKRGLCEGARSKISWTQVETGSAVTWKYPSCVLKGDGSVGEFYSVALTNNKQQADTGTKMVHIGKNSRSKIVSKGISAGESSNAYRGLVAFRGGSQDSRNFSVCDSLLIGDESEASTFPYIEGSGGSNQLEHEATTSRVSEEQLFYLQSRGLSEEASVSLLVNGFAEDVLSQLPMEFASEAQKLLGMKLEGTVG